MIPEFMPAPNLPLVRAVDATPAVQTEHCAAVHKGETRRTKTKNML